MLSSSLLFRAQAALAAVGRFRRLVVFGFEQVVLARLFLRHRKIAETIAARLLETKSIRIRPPELVVSDQDGIATDWSDGFAAVNAALFLNLRNPDALGPTRHALPAPAFRAIYLWDSAFIAQIWKWWDRDVAFDVLDAVLQTRDGDRLQHYVSEFARSALTQPPLIAWSLARLLDGAGADRANAWVARAYPLLHAYQNWLDRCRRLPNGLYAWAHAYESGVENAPRFGARDERRQRSTRTTAAPDLCAYVTLQREALAAMAARLGEGRQAIAHAREAEILRARVNAHLWDEREGLYFDRETSDGAFLRTRTIASLLPLWAGIPDARRARRLIARIEDPCAFNTLIPFPSVALDDPQFERDMWRGPVWVNTAFAVLEGLRRYGAHRSAADFAYRLCQGVYATYARTGRFFEFYDPTAFGVAALRRKRGNRWKAMTLGSGPVADFVGWTGLVNTLVVEVLFGVRATADGLTLEPRFPERAVGRSFSLSLPAWGVAIDLDVLPGGAVRGLIRAGQERPFRAAFGEPVPAPEARLRPGARP